MRYKQGCEPVGVSLVYKATCCKCENEATSHIYDGIDFYDAEKFPNLPNGRRYCYKHLQDAYAKAYIPNVTPEQIEAFRLEHGKNPVKSISITCDLEGKVEIKPLKTVLSVLEVSSQNGLFKE